MKKIILKNLKKDDINLLFKWSNLTSVINNSLKRKKIKFKEHKIWFNKTLNSKKNIKKIVCINQNPIGIIRLEKKYNNFYISYMISPKYRKKGYGYKALKIFLRKLEINKNFKNIVAIVKNNNKPSINIFNKLNFKLIYNKKNVLKYIYRL